MRFDYSVVKFTFEPDPLQNALRGTLLFEVNFTGWGDPLPEVLERPIESSREIHLRDGPPSEGLLGQVAV